MAIAITSDDGFFKSFHTRVTDFLTAEIIESFSKLQSDSQRFSFLYKLPIVHELPIHTVNSSKNVEFARKLKEDGNRAFQQGDNVLALNLYSKSLLNIPCGIDLLKETSIIIANRSAALYHLGQYNQAIQDIDDALSKQYPLELHYKVLERKAKSLLAIKCLKEAVGVFRSTLTSLDNAKLPTDKKLKLQTDVQIMLNTLGKHKFLTNVSYDAINKTLPQLEGGKHAVYEATSKKVEIKENEQMGRYAEANESIQVGDTVVVEKPFCSVLLAEHAQTHCSCCFKRLISTQPCPNCNLVAFCSSSCQQESLSTYHKYECCILPSLWKSGASVTCLMALRILTQKSISFFISNKNTIEKNEPLKKYRSSDYMTVYNLVRHLEQRTVNDLIHRTNMAVYLFRCLKASGFFSVDEESQTGASASDLTEIEEFVGGLLLRHLQILQFNSHEISELQLPQTGNIDFAKTVFLGGGVYPTLALFNHSCDPGVTRYFQSYFVIAKAIKNIIKGEMIGENYGPIFTQNNRDERRSTLKSQYWFDCTCTPCQENWPKFNDMNSNILRFKCDNPSAICKNVLHVPISTEEFMLKCSACEGHTNIFKGLKALQDTDSLYRIAKSHMDKNDVKNAQKIYIQILNLLDKTLAPPYKDYVLCQQAIRQCFLTMGNKFVDK